MRTKMRLGELLIASGLLTGEQLESALQGQRASGMKLGEYLIKQGICRESDVVDAVCRQTGIERYTPSRFPLNMSLSDRLPADVAQRTNAVPLLIRGDVLVVAMVDPLDIDSLDRLEIVTDREVEPVMCLRQEFTQLYAALYGHFNSMDGVMESITSSMSEHAAPTQDDLLIASETPKDELGQPDEAPVVRLVNSILTQAVRESASDIHISPERDSIQIRFRIDGKLRKTPSPPKNVGTSIVSRIKILANMDISITRVPQDGRFTMMVDRREINVRVSTLPTIYGENVVMRLLDMSTNHVYTLDKLGMSARDAEAIARTIQKPYGMILSTGPTGSGKSTSLYSILQMLNKPDVNAITLEDPVEYRIDGIRQVQLNVRAGMTFASGLRSILRQDPDVIMVGEIRDSETAQIAVQAALTGHLVLSTLHTNDAPGAVSRLMEMHIEPYLVASVLLCSFAQRLVRKVCPHCAEPYDPPRALLELFGIKETDKANFLRGKGCYHCGNTGYLGRIGIFEVMPVTTEIQEAIVRSAHAQEISAIAQRLGVMSTLAQDAASKVRAGITTVEEALRAAMV
ncbi:GspE/PulE family protein [uncultured Bilophila sp.]|uniref:GspE/PulE family protein n=1 Tax=uncultured Bilophila sp. TaxID=529385 RepID=UPI0025CC8332|nr:ATPase, T2SS/T4P/T4SS family [uncultured Bilophila sp.]